MANSDGSPPDIATEFAQQDGLLYLNHAAVAPGHNVPRTR